MLRNLLLAATLLFVTPAFADDAKPGCDTIQTAKDKFPGDYKQFNKEQFDTFKTNSAKLGSPIPETITDVWMTMVEGDAGRITLLGFDKDGCFVSFAKMSPKVFIEVVGGKPDLGPTT